MLCNKAWSSMLLPPCLIRNSIVCSDICCRSRFLKCKYKLKQTVRIISAKMTEGVIKWGCVNVCVLQQQQQHLAAPAVTCQLSLFQSPGVKRPEPLLRCHKCSVSLRHGGVFRVLGKRMFLAGSHTAG